MNGNIPDQLEKRVQDELEPGERILWQDMPVPHFFTAPAAVSFLFAIPCIGLTVFFMLGTAHFGGTLFTLLGIPFLLFGLAMLSAPIWVYRKSRKTVYVITERRAIAFEGDRLATIRSYTPGQLHNIYRKERKDGTGDVIIVQKEWRDAEGDRQKQEIGFIRIGNAKKVEAMLKQLTESL